MGISAYTGLDITVLAAISAIYDMTASHTVSHHACTGIVAQNSEGRIIHGRNLDYTIKTAMTNITVVVDFTSNGTIDYTAVTYVGMPGFNTVVKPGCFSLTQNERDKGTETPQSASPHPNLSP